MTFKDFFDVNILFNPSVYYEGEVILGGDFDFDRPDNDYLLANSKTQKRQNKYAQFLEQSFFKPLENICGSSSLAHTIFPKISLSVLDQDSKRKTVFSFSSFLAPQLLVFNASENLDQLTALGDNASLDDLIQFLKKVIRNERSIYNDVLNKGKNSPYYTDVFDLYNSYMQSTKMSMKFMTFLENMIESCTKRILATRSYKEFFSKEINIEALLECFDYDKFCLIAAQSVLDTCVTTEKLSNQVDNSIVYVKRYLDAVKEFRRYQPNYSCEILGRILPTGRKKMITINDIEQEYEALLARHPDFKFIKVELDDVSSLLKRYGYDDSFISSFDQTTKDAEVLFDILNKIEKNKELSASWTLIPKGSIQDDEIKKGVLQNHEERFSLEESEKVRRMIIGREFLESSDYLFRLEGINKFEGYIGYIYSNGTVIFEKYYENIKTKKVANGNATYIMNLTNFVEVSKLTKTEIIAKINNGEIVGVKRIFHREDMERWKAQISQLLAGDEYTDEVVDYINDLVNSQVIEKRGSQK